MPDFHIDELESERAQASKYPADRMPYSSTYRKRNRRLQYPTSRAGKAPSAKKPQRETPDDNYTKRFRPS